MSQRPTPSKSNTGLILSSSCAFLVISAVVGLLLYFFVFNKETTTTTPAPTTTTRSTTTTTPTTTTPAPTTTPPNPKIGRYVKLVQPNVAVLNIAEIQIFSNGVNVAKNKTVTMSSTYSDAYPAVKLVDDVFTGTNFAHTSGNDAPWMEIDLNTDLSIDQIVIKNRVDCCQHRILGSKLQIFDTNRSLKWTSDTIVGVNRETSPVASSIAYNTYTAQPPSTLVVGT